MQTYHQGSDFLLEMDLVQHRYFEIKIKKEIEKKIML